MESLLIDAGLTHIEPLKKGDDATLAWFAEWEGTPIFAKFFPSEIETRARTEQGIAESKLHPAIVPLRRAISHPEGTLFLYDRVTGETLGSKEARERFYALPLAEKANALRVLFSALAAVTEAGYVLVDIYEGNIIYDYDRKQVWLFDWDLSEKGNGFSLAMDRNYGSSRLMAPEEFQRDAWIDQRSNVFNLGRLATLALPDDGPWFSILAQATSPTRLNRHATVREFADAFAAVIYDRIV
jgi:serine/threonine protein kinase, bacterial